MVPTPRIVGLLSGLYRFRTQRASQSHEGLVSCTSVTERPTTDTPPFLPPRTAERYTDLHRLGAGGMGDVYRAFDGRLQRRVALKLIRLDRGERAKRTERLRREARALASLRHPNVVRLLDFDEDEGTCFFTMEFVDGVTLQSMVDQGGPLAPERAALLLAAVADGLAAAHERGLVHRDVKPDNILVARDVPLLLDFGLAKGAELDGDESLTRTGHFVGTPKFVPPEVLLGNPFTPGSDLFQLGLTAYMALTARHPLVEAEYVDIARGTALAKVAPPSSYASAVDADLDAVAMRLLAHDPADRYPSAAACADDLRRWSKRRATAPLPPGTATLELSAVAPVPPVRRRSRRPPSVRLLVPSILVLLALLTWAVAVPSKRRFVVPVEPHWQPSRGRFVVTWTAPGDAATIDIRPVDGGAWRSFPVEAGGVAVNDLEPGRRYRLRFRATDGRTSPQRTVEAPYSALAVDAVETTTAAGTPTVLRLRTDRPARLDVTYRQGADRQTLPCSPTRRTTDVFSYDAGRGLFDELTFFVTDGQGHRTTAALPVSALAGELLGVVQLVPTAEFEAAVSQRSVDDDEPNGGNPVSPALQSFLERPAVRRFLHVRPLAPLILADEALPIERRLELYRALTALLPMDRFYDAMERRRPFEVERLVRPFSELSTTGRSSGRRLAAWPAGLLLTASGTKRRRSTAAERPWVDVSFSAPPVLPARSLRLTVTTDAFSHRLALVGALNSRMALRFHCRPLHLLMTRMEPRATDGSHRMTLSRSIPSELSSPDGNVLRFSVERLMEGGQAAGIRMYAVELAEEGYEREELR